MNIFEMPKNDFEDAQKNPKEEIAPAQTNELKETAENNFSDLVMAKIKEDRQKELRVAEATQARLDAEALAALRSGRQVETPKIINSETGKKTENKKENSLEQIKQEWQAFYRKVFGIEVDFSQVEIPEHEKDFVLPILMAKGLTSQQIIEKWREYCPVADTISGAMTGDFEGKIVSERSCTQDSYAVLVQDLAEVKDGELKNFSAEDVWAESLATTTLKERLVYGLRYFLETGKHLDQESVTICAGSRLPNGKVPTVSFLDGKVLVILEASDKHANNYGPRAVKTKAAGKNKQKLEANGEAEFKLAA